MRPIDIEGYSPDEILNLPDEQLDALVLSGEPLVCRAGSAEILGELKIKGDSLLVQLAQIDGGGEGVLPTLTSLAHRYAERRGFEKSGMGRARSQLCRTQLEVAPRDGATGLPDCGR